MSGIRAKTPREFLFQPLGEPDRAALAAISQRLTSSSGISVRRVCRIGEEVNLRHFGHRA